MLDNNPRDENVIREILDAATDLFRRYGLKKTTMDDVGKAVGKGKSTLYYYFPGKTELFEAVVKDELDKMVREIRQAINAQSSSKEKLRAYLMVKLKFREKVDNLGQVVYDEIFDNFKEICRIKVEFEEVQLGIIREIVVGGVQGGEFRKLSEEEISFFCRWTLAAFGGLDLPLSTTSALTANAASCHKIVDFILFGIGR